MARIIPMAGIESISGKVGNMIFKTRKKADGSTDVRMYKNPYRDARGRKINVRSTPLSDKEIASRQLFMRANAEVNRRKEAGDKRNRREIFKEVYAQLKIQTIDD